MSGTEHLSDELLVRALDDELASPEAAVVESHLSCCEECKRRHCELRALSVGIESALTATALDGRPEQRDSLCQALETPEHQLASARPRKVLWSFGWGMAVAATLTVGILFGPQWARRGTSMDRTTGQSQSSVTFEVDGETFTALPYSNPDLPLTSPHIVQMQIPISSLSNAGIILEPISKQVSAPDDSVLADVLLGTDGQPMGVHVLRME
jgi:hypothetical protein